MEKKKMMMIMMNWKMIELMWREGVDEMRCPLIVLDGRCTMTNEG